MTLVRKFVLGGALAASTLVAASPAMADGYRYRHRHGGDGAAIAVGAGIVGLALGAAIASDRRNDGYYYDRGYRYPRYRTTYVYRSYPRHYRGYDRGYYYDNYNRDYYRRYNRSYYPRGYYDRSYGGYYGGW